MALSDWKIVFGLNYCLSPSIHGARNKKGMSVHKNEREKRFLFPQNQLFFLSTCRLYSFCRVQYYNISLWCLTVPSGIRKMGIIDYRQRCIDWNTWERENKKSINCHFTCDFFLLSQLFSFFLPIWLFNELQAENNKLLFHCH